MPHIITACIFIHAFHNHMFMESVCASATCLGPNKLPFSIAVVSLTHHTSHLDEFIYRLAVQSFLGISYSVEKEQFELDMMREAEVQCKDAWRVIEADANIENEQLCMMWAEDELAQAVRAVRRLEEAEAVMRSRLMRASAQRWNRRGLTKCVVSWRSWLRHRVSLRVGAAKIVSRLRNASLASAMETWRSITTRQRTRKSQLWKAVARMERDGLVSAWASWKDFAETSSRMRTAASRVIARIQGVAVVGAFERWREHWEQRRSLRRIASRLSNMAVSRCFDRWLAALDGQPRAV